MALSFLSPDKLRSADPRIMALIPVFEPVAFTEAGRQRRVDLVGLGVGTLAAYGRHSDVFCFYEINPAVVSCGNA